MNRLLLAPHQHEQLWRHLVDKHTEQVAFIFAETDMSNGVDFRARDVYCVPPEELSSQYAFHISLTDESQAKIIKTAWDMGLSLVELHSHLGCEFPACFSGSDLRGLEEFVPHVRWRLKGKPYLAVVVAPRDFDALVWSDGDVEQLDSIEIGGSLLAPTNLTLQTILRSQGSRRD